MTHFSQQDNFSVAARVLGALFGVRLENGSMTTPVFATPISETRKCAVSTKCPPLFRCLYPFWGLLKPWHYFK